MCEIHLLYSFKGNLTETERYEIVRMLSRGAKRNFDGYGCFTDKALFKRPIEYERKFDNELMNGLGDCKFIVGHNRKMTDGEKRHIDTHPFSVGDWTFVHNGVIDNHEDIRKEFKIKTNVKCDSYVIGYLLNKFKCKPIQAIRKTTKLLEGKFSILAYHKPSKRLFYFRHDKKFEFSLMEMKDGRTILVGSTFKETYSRYSFLEFKYGFTVPNGNIIANKTPVEDKIYEITDKGLILKSEFEIKPEPELPKNHPDNEKFDHVTPDMERETNELEKLLRPHAPEITLQRMNANMIIVYNDNGLIDKYNILTYGYRSNVISVANIANLVRILNSKVVNLKV